MNTNLIWIAALVLAIVGGTTVITIPCIGVPCVGLTGLVAMAAFFKSGYEFEEGNSS